MAGSRKRAPSKIFGLADFGLTESALRRSAKVKIAVHVHLARPIDLRRLINLSPKARLQRLREAAKKRLAKFKTGWGWAIVEEPQRKAESSAIRMRLPARDLLLLVLLRHNASCSS